MYIDTHCHIDDEKLCDKDLIIDNLVKNKVDYAINMGIDLKSSLVGKELSDKYDRVFFAVGFHPSELDKYNSNSLDQLKEISLNKKCVAIGEIGLDYHFEPFNKDKQKTAFIEQIELANFLKLPFSVHSRDATQDTFNILKDNKDKIKNGVIMHCFSGSIETALEYIKLGVYISFSGTLTFKNAKNLVEVASRIPLEFCLTETDSPYLSPEPFRGTTNEPKNVSFVLNKLAEIKGLTQEETSFAVINNAKRVFNKLV